MKRRVASGSWDRWWSEARTPVGRLAREREGLVQAPAGRAFRLEARLTRVVATDYLVSVDTNRYAVPLTLTGQTEEVRGRDGHLEMRHRGLVATHPVFGGRQQLRILPEHGRGPIAPNARVRYSTGRGSTGAPPLDVEVRDLACYEAAYGLGVRNDDAAVRAPRRAPAATAPQHGARAARGATPGSVDPGAVVRRLPRPAAERGGDGEDRQAHPDPDELGPLPFLKGLDSFAFRYQPSVDRKQIQKLSLCHFVEHGENLVLLGPPGPASDRCSGVIRFMLVSRPCPIPVRDHFRYQSAEKPDQLLPPIPRWWRCGGVRFEQHRLPRPSLPSHRSVLLPSVSLPRRRTHRQRRATRRTPVSAVPARLERPTQKLPASHPLGKTGEGPVRLTDHQIGRTTPAYHLNLGARAWVKAVVNGPSFTLICSSMPLA